MSQLVYVYCARPSYPQIQQRYCTNPIYARSNGQRLNARIKALVTSRPRKWVCTVALHIQGCDAVQVIFISPAAQEAKVERLEVYRAGQEDSCENYRCNTYRTLSGQHRDPARVCREAKNLVVGNTFKQAVSPVQKMSWGA